MKSSAKMKASAPSREEHPALRALHHAPKGEALTVEERARREMVRRDPRPAIAHEQIKRELEERRQRGE
ncbi:hypothetical protein [Pendulispora albinea]|uniref:Uncharacterized protein n=1 Tax=Pendulispora albinea TaxID=2741071 RepID=A0ABZ2M4U9_9BACT